MHAEAAYAFRHALLREAAHQLQLPSDRGRLHATALAILEELSGGRPVWDEEPLDGRFLEHATDAFAVELAEHSRMGEGDRSEAAALYQWRVACLADRGYRHDDALRAFERAAAIAPNPRVRVAALHRGAAAAWHSGAMAECERRLGEAEAQALREGDARARVACLNSRATIEKRRGNLDLHLALSREALDAARAAGDRRGAAMAESNIGITHAQSGRSEEARRALGSALALARELGDATTESICLGNLAFVAAGEGRLDQAEKGYRDAVSTARRARSLTYEGTWLKFLVSLLCDNGRLAEAESLFAEAERAVTESADRWGLCTLMGGKARLARAAGRTDEAERLQLKAILGYREIGDLVEEGAALGNLANLYDDVRRFAEAETCYMRSIALMRSVGERRRLALVIGNQARCYARQGLSARAELTFEEAVAAADSGRNRPLQGRWRVEWSIELVRTGDVARARAAWTEGRRIMEETRQDEFLAFFRKELDSALAAASLPPLSEDGSF